MGHSAHRGGVLHAGDKDTVDRTDTVFPLLLFLPFIIRSFRRLRIPLTEGGSTLPRSLPSIIRSFRGLEMPLAEGVYTLL